MIPFEYLEPRTVEEACGLLAEDQRRTLPLAGGTDLLALVKDGVSRPKRLVSLAGIEELGGILRDADGLRLGASATLADLTQHPAIAREYPALLFAALSVATPQVRALATVGGNLCQRPRCWYYRSAAFYCYKKGGDVCYGATGHSHNLAVMDGFPAFFVHPSDLAPPLIALGATVECAGPSGRRRMPLEGFFVGPGQQRFGETALGAGELLVAVHVPPPVPGSRGVFLKTRNRAAADFALVSVAALVRAEAGAIARADVVLGGVAPTPVRARDVEEAVVGCRVEGFEPEGAASRTLQGARPLSHNAFKVPMARGLVARALALATGGLGTR